MSRSAEIYDSSRLNRSRKLETICSNATILGTLAVGLAIAEGVLSTQPQLSGNFYDVVSALTAISATTWYIAHCRLDNRGDL